MSSVLVIGANGFVGNEVSLILVKNGFKVYGLVRRDPENLIKNEIIPVVCSAKETEKWLPIANKVDIIIDVSADVGDQSVTSKILEALKSVVEKRPNTFIIFTSGVLPYGDNDRLADENDLYPEKQFFGWKIQIEQEYKKLNATIIQPSFIFGKHQSFIGYFFEAVVNQNHNGNVKIYAKPGLTQGFIHVYDLARFYYLVIQNKESVRGQVLIANSHNEKIDDIIRSIGKVSKKQVNSIEYVEPIKENPLTECLTYNLIFSYAKASKLIGYYPTQNRIVDDTERYYNSWLTNKEKDSSLQKLIDVLVPKQKAG